MPKRSKSRKINKSRKIKTRKNKSIYKGRIKGGGPSVSCANSGSVDHRPPQWYSTIKGGSINDDLYNQYTDMTPYSISK
jgi:hypothetical protein